MTSRIFDTWLLIVATVDGLHMKQGGTLAGFIRVVPPYPLPLSICRAAKPEAEKKITTRESKQPSKRTSALSRVTNITGSMIFVSSTARRRSVVRVYTDL